MISIYVLTGKIFMAVGGDHNIELYASISLSPKKSVDAAACA
jgi:hypothetical protein